MNEKPEILSFTDPVLERIGRLADERGIEAYVVGGYVRDLILQRPVKDIDIVVVGDGVAFARTVASELQRKNIVVYEKFGTAMLPLENCTVEFVGARKESYSGLSRKPDVEGGTLADDLARRDFTVNALAASLNAQRYGEVVDPFGGKADIGRKLLRTPLEPDQTFADDPLRMMRAVRFAAQIGFTIDPDTFAAITRMKDRLSIVSQERTTDEFLKLMKSDRPSLGLRLMFESGMMHIVLPEVAAMAGVDQRDDAGVGNDDGKKYYHKDVFLHTLMVVDNISTVTDNVWLRFAALVHDIAKPRTKMFREGIGWSFYGHEEIGARMQKGIFHRLRLPLDFLPYVEKIVRLHLRPMALVDDGVTASAVRRLLFEAGNEVDDLMVLCKADITSKNPALVAQYTANYDRVHVKIVEVEEKDRIRNWQPPVKGDEIMRVCRLESGPLIGKLKTAIEDAILDGRIPNDHDAALEYLLTIKDTILKGI